MIFIIDMYLVHKLIKRVLQNAINVEYGRKWGLTINKDKTCYITYTTAGLRQNYSSKYKISIKIDQNEIPQEPNPTFQGITLDSKINFKLNIIEIEKKITTKKKFIKLKS